MSVVTNKNSLFLYWAGIYESPQFRSLFVLLIKVSALEAVRGSGITSTGILNLSDLCMPRLSSNSALCRSSSKSVSFVISTLNLLRFLVFSMEQT